MQLNDLRPAEGSRKNRKRIGRGNSSGHGTTAGRGTKGQLSRSGGGAPVNVARLEALFADGETVDADSLVAKGVIKHNYIPVKVLGDGELTKKLTVKVDKVSASAQAKIEAAGGKVEQAC